MPTILQKQFWKNIAEEKRENRRREMDKNREELIEEVSDASIAIEDFWDLSVEDQDKVLNVANKCINAVLQFIGGE